MAWAGDPRPSSTFSRHLAHEQEQELRREVELLQLVTSPAPADGQPGQPVSQQWLEAAMMTRKPSIVRNPALHTPPPG